MKLNLRTNPFFWSRLGFCYDPPRADKNGKQILFSQNLEKYRRIHDSFRDSGICCHTTILHSGWVAPGKYDYTLTDEILDALLSGNPDIYYMPRVKLNVPPEWCRENPCDTFVYEDGPRTAEEIAALVGTPLHDWFGNDQSYGYSVNGGYNSYKDDRPNVGGVIGLQSFSSEKWISDACEALRRLIAHIDASPYAGQIIGYHIAYGCCGETAMWGYYGNKPHLGDFGVNARKAFRNFEVKKYGSCEKAAEALGFSDFGEVDVPSGTLRENDNSSLRKLFFDRAENLVCADYQEFLSESNIHAAEEFCRTVKEIHPELYAGIFYGYLTVPRSAVAGHLAIDGLVSSQYIDFAASPKGYYKCLPGEPGGEQSPAQSINRRKVWLDEIDNLTHLDPRNNGKVKDFHETKVTLWREGLKNITRNQGFWWMDLGEGSFDSPEIMGVISDITRFGKELCAKAENKSVSEVLFLTDEHTIASMSLCYALNSGLRLELPAQIHMMGTPIDVLRLSDLADCDLAGYKLIVFADAFKIPSEFRERILGKISKDTVVVHHYAPGILSPDFDPVNVRRTCGFSIREFSPSGMDIKSEGYPEVCEKTYGGAPGILDFPTVEIVPEDGISVLSRYSDGRIKTAKRAFCGFTSVLCTYPSLTAHDLRILAEESGVRMYAPCGVTVYGDNRAIGFFSCAAEEFDTVLPNGKTVHVALCEKDMQIEKLIDD